MTQKEQIDIFCCKLDYDQEFRFPFVPIYLNRLI